MATVLSIYNDALGWIGERALATTSESNESCRALNDQWARTVAYCIEQGNWKWAMRSVQMSPDSSVTPAFGLANAFEKPDDWVRTYTICTDEMFAFPDLRVKDENGFWWSDSDPLYVRYISNGADFGMNMAVWPETFNAFVACYLAFKISNRVTQSKADAVDLQKQARLLMTDARSKNAMSDPPGFAPQSTWISARTRRSGYMGWC